MITAAAHRRRVVWLAVGSCLVTACAIPRVGPVGAGGSAFTLQDDERAMWKEAEKEEAELRARVKIYENAPLGDYLAGVADRMVPEDVKAAGGPALKIVVLEDPTLNAFTMPTGRLYLHTGLLSRLDNEAQLATILGRALAHYVNRDALRFARAGRVPRALDTVLGAAAISAVAAAARSVQRSGNIDAAVLSPTAGAVLGLGLPLAAIASITGYGRDLERAADAHVLTRLVASGYDPRAAPRAYQGLRSESLERGPLEIFFLGSPPRLQERIDAAEELLRTMHAPAALAPGRVQNTEEFNLRMRPVVRDNAALDIRAGRFDLARRQLDRVLAATPDDPIALLDDGDLHRLQSQRARTAADRAAHAQKALARYERAAELDPAYPDPFRQLGLLYYQEQDLVKARAAFEKYLALNPDAPDASRIRDYVTELAR